MIYSNAEELVKPLIHHKGCGSLMNGIMKEKYDRLTETKREMVSNIT